jgi:glycerol-3-phosphate O-acyltransferase
MKGTPATAHPSPGVARPHVLSGEDIADLIPKRVVSRLLARAESDPASPPLEEIIQETIYTEHLRLSAGPPGAQADQDRHFLESLGHGLVRADAETLRRLLFEIAEHYTQEIAGHFNPLVYGMATQLVPPALDALLGASAEAHDSAWAIGDRILLEGETAALQALARVGTVVLAPTHVSNLDSLVVGTAIMRLGLPPFAYAAGLNLFQNPLLGFFMRHLGAYTVDRTKRDPFYRETLKEYATVLLERGQHSLLFPGGTRSRSGALESQLKKGLLGTAPPAYRHALVEGAARPRIFVVPCTLSYPLVLEAPSLIEEFLHTQGGPQYVDTRDESDRARHWLTFFLGMRRLDQHVRLRIGRPLDWLGNAVDDDGTSRDPQGRAVDPARYLMAQGRLVEDEARDAEYTRLCAGRLLAAYRRDNVALAPQVLSYVVWAQLRRQRPQPNLFRFLRGLGPATTVPLSQVLPALTRLLAELNTLVDAGAICQTDSLRRSPSHVLGEALATFATYHPAPVIERTGDHLQVGDTGLLLYYRNRLGGYGLLGVDEPLPAVRWSAGAGWS